jgi:triphosphoribosyl-dephospho-CoA synthetase
MITVKQYQGLLEKKKNIDLQVIHAKRELAKKESERDAILAKYNVSTVEEFNAMYQARKEEAEKLFAITEEYIETTTAKLDMLDKIIYENKTNGGGTASGS